MVDFTQNLSQPQGQGVNIVGDVAVPSGVGGVANAVDTVTKGITAINKSKATSNATINSQYIEDFVGLETDIDNFNLGNTDELPPELQQLASESEELSIALQQRKITPDMAQLARQVIFNKIVSQGGDSHQALKASGLAKEHFGQDITNQEEREAANKDAFYSTYFERTGQLAAYRKDGTIDESAMATYLSDSIGAEQALKDDEVRAQIDLQTAGRKLTSLTNGLMNQTISMIHNPDLDTGTYSLPNGAQVPIPEEDRKAFVIMRKMQTPGKDWTPEEGEFAASWLQAKIQTQTNVARQQLLNIKDYALLTPEQKKAFIDGQTGFWADLAEQPKVLAATLQASNAVQTERAVAALGPAGAAIMAFKQVAGESFMGKTAEISGLMEGLLHKDKFTGLYSDVFENLALRVDRLNTITTKTGDPSPEGVERVIDDPSEVSQKAYEQNKISLKGIVRSVFNSPFGTLAEVNKKDPKVITNVGKALTLRLLKTADPAELTELGVELNTEGAKSLFNVILNRDPQEAKELYVAMQKWGNAEVNSILDDLATEDIFQDIDFKIRSRKEGMDSRVQISKANISFNPNTLLFEDKNPVTGPIGTTQHLRQELVKKTIAKLNNVQRVITSYGKQVNFSEEELENHRREAFGGLVPQPKAPANDETSSLEPPQEAIDLLRSNINADTIAQFDTTFGDGAAQRTLTGGEGRVEVASAGTNFPFPAQRPNKPAVPQESKKNSEFALTDKELLFDLDIDLEELAQIKSDEGIVLLDREQTPEELANISPAAGGKGKPHMIYDDADPKRKIPGIQGNLTGGYGHLLTAAERKRYPEGTPIPQEVADEWYRVDVQEANNDVKVVFGEVSGELKNILFNMAFNMGRGRKTTPTKVGRGLLSMEDMIEAVKARDFDKAADEMADSKWAKEDVPNRAARLISRMRALTSNTK